MRPAEAGLSGDRAIDGIRCLVAAQRRDFTPLAFPNGQHVLLRSEDQSDLLLFSPQMTQNKATILDDVCNTPRTTAETF